LVGKRREDEKKKTSMAEKKEAPIKTKEPRGRG